MSREGVMSNAILEAAARAAGPGPITVEQYHEMLKQGVLWEGAPIELLKGGRVGKTGAKQGDDPMSINRLHVRAVMMLAGLLRAVEPPGCHAQSQQPIALPPDSEPEPDGAV